jgi:hypothetical protein
MTTNIATLALNLLVAERENHRQIFAEKIRNLVEPISGKSGKEKLLKNNFLTILPMCVEKPDCEYRDLFFEIAQHYNLVVNGTAVAEA